MIQINLNAEKAVVYARYSSHSQGEQSIEGQIAAAKKYAAERGYTLVGEYVDRAMTGKNDNREAFQKMLADCAKHLFTVIIVWKVDRFGRNREEIALNKHRARKHGVRVEYIAENLGQGPESVILESVLEGMAEYYSLQLSQNIARGRRESAKKHHVIGPVPLGYRKGPDQTYEIDPATAPIVRRIYAEYLAGKTMAEITRGLNGAGLHTGRGDPFTNNSLRKILHNEKYVGIYDYNNGEIRDENAIPPILDADTFYAVQEMTKQNLRRRVSRDAREADYLLTGKLFCGHCGGLMVGESGTSKTGTVHRYYSCHNHKRGRGCTKRAIRQDVIENAVLQAVRDALSDELLEQIADAVWAFAQEHDETRERMQAINAEITENDRATRNIVAAIEAGAYSPALQERLAELASQRAALADALVAEQATADLRLTRDHVLYFLTRFRDGDVADPVVQKRMIETYVNSVYVYDDKLAINLNCADGVPTVPLSEMQTEGPGFVPSAFCSTDARRYELIVRGRCVSLYAGIKK